MKRRRSHRERNRQRAGGTRQTTEVGKRMVGYGSPRYQIFGTCWFGRPASPRARVNWRRKPSPILNPVAVFTFWRKWPLHQGAEIHPVTGKRDRQYQAEKAEYCDEGKIRGAGRG